MEPRPPYHRDNLEEQLLDCAARIVSTRGVAALSLRELGREAGVSRTAAYHYFPNKAALLARVGERGFERLRDRLIAATADQTGDSINFARAYFRAYLDFAREDEAFFRLMFANILRREHAAPPDSLVASFAFSSPAAQQSFAILLESVAKVSETPATGSLAFANAVWAFVHGLSVLVIDNNIKHADVDPVLEAGLRVFLQHSD